jgi:hypothetical protein
MEEELEELAKQAAKIAEKVPEKFQTQCFEIVFQSFITGKLPSQASSKAEGVSKDEANLKPSVEFVVPIDVRAFLQQNNVPEESLPKLFLMQGNEVRPTYKIETTKKAKAQMQIALLSALENALRGSIRQRCKELRCYDSRNFNSIFKGNHGLFKSLEDMEHVELSPDGKSELAEAITAIAK